ncbi:MAG: ferric reductase-like transmembrane domain-containing protein [Actinomycetota bacterium]|nr:ferric reductase-like transmembrane domain-containing protein [Actinomycetota bacterium]
MIATGRLLWYVNRGSGAVTLALLTTSVVLGIVTTMRWRSPRWPRFVTAALHRNVSLLSVAFLSVHVFSAIADGYAPIGWKDAVVPFVSQYRPLWLGVGTVALDLFAAIVVTSLFRERLGPRAWKLVHWSAYACWPIAFVHGLGMGTDVGASWMIAIDGACLLAVALAVLWRFNAPPAEPQLVTPLGAGASTGETRT